MPISKHTVRFLRAGLGLRVLLHPRPDCLYLGYPKLSHLFSAYWLLFTLFFEYILNKWTNDDPLWVSLGSFLCPCLWGRVPGPNWKRLNWILGKRVIVCVYVLLTFWNQNQMICGSFNFCFLLLFSILNHPVPLAFLLMKSDREWDTPWQEVVRVLGREHMAFHPVWETAGRELIALLTRCPISSRHWSGFLRLGKWPKFLVWTVFISSKWKKMHTQEVQFYHKPVFHGPNVSEVVGDGDRTEVGKGEVGKLKRLFLGHAELTVCPWAQWSLPCPAVCLWWGFRGNAPPPCVLVLQGSSIRPSPQIHQPLHSLALWSTRPGPWVFPSFYLHDSHTFHFRGLLSAKERGMDRW